MSRSRFGSSRILFVAALALAGCATPYVAPPAQTATPAAQDAARPATPITAEAMRARIGFLAADALRGRDTPSPELEVAAAYLASESSRMGLRPAGDDGTYLQRWPYTPRQRPGSDAPPPGAEPAYPANVVAVLPGRDPALRDEHIILSAHYDHVGVGAPMNGDSIYNGADDNASGTAALLEIARALAALPEAERPRRSVAFLWVSGEEKGLLGSRWYSENPTIPLEQTVANFNLDMVSSDLHRDSVVVIGKDYSTLGALVDRVNARLPQLRLITSDDIWPEQQFFFRSDQLNFMRKEIPALFFFTGVHRCYHRPCDTVDFIDPGKAARVANLVFHSVREMADAPQRPQWDAAGLEEVRRRTRR